MQTNQQQAPLLQNQINPFQPSVYNLSPERDIRQSYAADLNPLNEKKQSYHVKALIGTFFIWFGVPVIIVCTVQNVFDLTPGAVGAICGGIYLFYLILSMCCNPLFSYLQKIQHGNKFKEQYQRVQGLDGHFVFNVVCYHYETRYHTRTVSDGNGGTKTQTYTSIQKVVTHRNSQNLFPSLTKDDSGNVDDVRAMTLVVFIHYLVDYRFFDNQSRQIFDYKWYAFKKNNMYDVHQDFVYVYTVPGLNQRMAFFIGQKKPNWYKFLVFWTILGLIWPYSMWIESNTSRYQIKFLKVLTMGKSNIDIDRESIFI